MSRNFLSSILFFSITGRVAPAWSLGRQEPAIYNFLHNTVLSADSSALTTVILFSPIGRAHDLSPCRRFHVADLQFFRLDNTRKVGCCSSLPRFQVSQPS